MCKKMTNLDLGGSIVTTKIYLSQVGICMKISSAYSHLFSNGTQKLQVLGTHLSVG